MAAGLVIGRPWNDRPITSGIGIPPRDRSTGLASLKGIHLRGIGPLLVVVIKRSPDAIANQPANSRADQRAGDMASDTSAEL